MTSADPANSTLPAGLAGEIELLSTGEMYAADAAATEGGVSGLELMEAAGQAVLREIRRRMPPGTAAILCGPGNNGGDGFVAARLLRAQGWTVRLGLLGGLDRLKGDAAANARRWTGECSGAVEALAPKLVEGADVVVDALFGAGLTRPLGGVARETVSAINGGPGRAALVVAVDVPSGISGDSGEVLGETAVQADLTVTFFRKKPGHLLLPGRLNCGATAVADIGIPASVLDAIGPATAENLPELWRARFPVPLLSDHKYSRGHAVISGGGFAPGQSTGAARLAARAAARIGAGLVTVTSPAGAMAIHASGLACLLLREVGDASEFAGELEDARRNAVLIGPGNGVVPDTRARVVAALSTGKAVVLDADALSVFADDRDALFAAIHASGGPTVLTPHDGEYARLFDHKGDRLSRARAAARDSGAVVVLKGADTVVAAPGGNAAIAANAPADLATAGSGDVLAGMITGLLAQRMEAFDAAAAAVWMHGECGRVAGAGLVADDLPEAIPAILAALRTNVLAGLRSG